MYHHSQVATKTKNQVSQFTTEIKFTDEYQKTSSVVSN